jgi:hypothetical protein
MLTITPIAAAFGLVIYDPSRWGGEIKFGNILFLAIFGLISRPLWFTYIPALIFTPVIMKRLSAKEIYYTTPLGKFYAISALWGSAAGIFIIFPAILIAGPKSIDIALNWAWSGVVAGVTTYFIISSIYRLIK